MSTGYWLPTPKHEEASVVLYSQGACNYSKCSYCPNYTENSPGKFNHQAFLDYLEDEARSTIRDKVSSVFIQEGNLLSLSNRRIIKILRALKKQFESLEQIAVYSSVYSVKKKTSAELQALKSEGLKRIYLGCESGSDEVLKLLNKGFTVQELKDTAQKVSEQDIELCVYVLVGSGGKALSRIHIEETSKVINEIQPKNIECYTLVPFPGTPLYKLKESGDFVELTLRETVMETRSLVEQIGVPLSINCHHLTNFCKLDAELPEKREMILKQMDYCLEMDESKFAN